MDTRSQGSTGWHVVIVSLLVLILAVMVGGMYWFYKYKQTPAQTSTTVATCNTADLQLSLGTSEGTAGTIYRHAVITNNGSATCTLSGYPAGFLVNGSGSVLGGGAASNALYTPTTITLAHGQAAHTVLGFPEAGNFNPGVCSVAATNLRIYPPGSITALEVSSTEKSCPGFSITALQAGA